MSGQFLCEHPELVRQNALVANLGQKVGDDGVLGDVNLIHIGILPSVDADFGRSTSLAAHCGQFAGEMIA